MAKKKSDADSPKGMHPEVRFWLDELKACRKRESDFLKEGQRIIEIYEGNKKHTTPFNILFSNTETLMPALYSATPRPIVQRRFKDDDPLGKSASQAGQRVLEFQVDTNIEGYETFDEVMKAGTLQALLPGRSYSRVKYDADVIEEPSAEDPEQTEPAYKESELVCVESQPWNRVLVGYAKKWSKVPWIAFEHFVDKDEATRLFGKPLANKLKYTEGEPNEAEESRAEKGEEKHQGVKKTAHLYEIWDKDGGKKVRYLCPDFADDFLKVDDDPLQLTGFFPCPRPLMFIEKVDSLTPTAPYTIYENQAAELNRLTLRIKNVTEAIKARGLYDAELGDDIGKLMEASDNTLVPADKSSSLAAEKGLDNAIWFMPVEQLVATLVQLYQAREQCKQVIYEITGISDIVRGASKASETLGAQQIKTQWGTLRLKNKQKEVARYARDLLRMMLELAANNFNEETWAKMTGLPFLLTEKYNELTAVARALQQQLSMQPPQPAMPGAPPPPASPLVQQLQQVQQQLQAPQWSQVLALLKDDLARAYRVDIETNSTVEPEAAEDQKNISDLMMALGQYLQGVGPLIINGAMPFQAAQSMMLAIARRFRFGTEIEDYIKAMQPPTPPDQGNGPEQVQKEKDMAAKELDMQKKQAEGDLKMKGMDQDMAFKQREMDLQMREAQLKVDQDVFKMRQQSAQEQLNLKAQGETQKLDFKQKAAQMENTKYKTENVVNQKADQTLGKGITAMQDMVKQLVQAVAMQSTENQKMLDGMVKAITAPRVKKAIRGKDGRLEGVEEMASAI